jgi:hypothetical protein
MPGNLAEAAALDWGGRSAGCAPPPSRPSDPAPKPRERCSTANSIQQNPRSPGPRVSGRSDTPTANAVVAGIHRCLACVAGCNHPLGLRPQHSKTCWRCSESRFQALWKPRALGPRPPLWARHSRNAPGLRFLCLFCCPAAAHPPQDGSASTPWSTPWCLRCTGTCSPANPPAKRWAGTAHCSRRAAAAIGGRATRRQGNAPWSITPSGQNVADTEFE